MGFENGRNLQNLQDSCIPYQEVVLGLALRSEGSPERLWRRKPSAVSPARERVVLISH